MPSSKHIALIAYYWPPTGGSGVQRWLFCANYFVNKGVDVTVFTPKRPRVAETDLSLLAKIDPRITVMHVDGWEPIRTSKKAISENVGHKKGAISAFMRFVRANFFIPDARVHWAHAALKAFELQHELTPFDALITTGPPHSLHLVGLKTKKTIPWIADFRDPWVGFFQNQSLPMLSFAKKRQQYFQHIVLRAACRIVVTSPSLATEFSLINPSTTVLTNGYEKTLSETQTSSTTMVYAGSLKAQQNPKNLWRAVLDLTKEDEVFASRFSLEVYGKVADVIKQEVTAMGIDKWVTFCGYTSKEKLNKCLPNAKALLLLGIDMPNTQNVIHGKLFEYMAAKRPILGIGSPSSDMKALFDVHNLGVFTSFDNYEEIKEVLLKWFSKDEIVFEHRQTEQYQRDVIAQNYLNLILDSL